MMCRPAIYVPSELNLLSSKISIKSGENFDLRQRPLLMVMFLNGIYAGATEAKRSANILGMKFNVPSKWIGGYGSYVLVIPPDAKLDQITINTNHCDITCDSLIASKINTNVKNLSGDLKIDQLLSADNASVSVDGTLDAASSQIAINGNISANKRLSIGTSWRSKGQYDE